MALVACPFCREMYSTAEAEICPMCALPLTALHKLPPSLDYDPADGDRAVAPEDEPVGLLSLRHGRGPLVVLALLGLGLFFLPWIDLRFPVAYELTGADVARRIGWTWAIPAAWSVMLPTVLSRRTRRRMKGARVAVGMMALIPGLSAATLLMFPPHGRHGLHLDFSFLWPLHLTLGLSALGLLLALLFGVSFQREADPAPLAEPPETPAPVAEPSNQTLH